MFAAVIRGEVSDSENKPGCFQASNNNEQVTGSSRGERLDPVSLRPVARFLALTLSKYERGRPPAAAEAKP